MNAKCPVCSANVKIMGETTKYYEPIEKKFKYESLEDWFLDQPVDETGRTVASVNIAWKAARELKDE